MTDGNLSLPQNLALKLMQELQRPPQLEPPKAILTGRELDILEGIARGLSNQEIAGELAIGATTVRTHAGSLFNKLGLANRTQVALYPIERGLTD